MGPIASESSARDFAASLRDVLDDGEVGAVVFVEHEHRKSVASSSHYEQLRVSWRARYCLHELAAKAYLLTGVGDRVPRHYGILTETQNNVRTVCCEAELLDEGLAGGVVEAVGLQNILAIRPVVEVGLSTRSADGQE